MSVTLFIIQYVIGRNASAARPPDRINPWYSARSTLPAFDLTAYVPMIEAMIETAPSTSGYSATVPT